MKLETLSLNAAHSERKSDGFFVQSSLALTTGHTASLHCFVWPVSLLHWAETNVFASEPQKAEISSGLQQHFPSLSKVAQQKASSPAQILLFFWLSTEIVALIPKATPGVDFCA